MSDIQIIRDALALLRYKLESDFLHDRSDDVYCDEADKALTRLEKDDRDELIERLVSAAQAAINYDNAIIKRVANGRVNIMDTGGGIAMGDDLDALYLDWITKAQQALATLPERFRK